MTRLPILFAALFLLSTSSFSQQGYEIRLKVKGLQDTTAYLGYFINESTFIRDTAEVDSEGVCVFTGTKPLAHGVYMFVLKTTRQFEFLVGDDQHFTLTTDLASPIERMKVSGDGENELFFKSIFFNIERNREAEPFIKTLADSTKSETEKQHARTALNKINDKVVAFQDELIAGNPRALAARILKAQKPIVVPDAPTKSDGTADRDFQLRWYRQHFFDHMDLADDALLRLSRPIYRDKIYEYLDKLYLQHPDTLLKAIHTIVEKAKQNRETYKYAVLLCFLKYQNHEIMGLDEVYVKLFDKYFASGEMDFWVTAGTKSMFKKEADRYRKSLIGAKGANLVMQDANFQPRALYDIENNYSILYFFQPDCPRCREETPKLVDFYQRKKFDCQVYAVCSDSSMVKMRDYIKANNLTWITVNGPRSYVGPYHDLYDAMYTPTLYVLDRQKKIIGKKIPAERLEEFLTYHERSGK